MCFDTQGSSEFGGSRAIQSFKSIQGLFLVIREAGWLMMKPSLMSQSNVEIVRRGHRAGLDMNPRSGCLSTLPVDSLEKDAEVRRIDETAGAPGPSFPVLRVMVHENDGSTLIPEFLEAIDYFCDVRGTVLIEHSASWPHFGHGIEEKEGDMLLGHQGVKL